MKEFVTVGYSYNELSDAAKEEVKQWYLNDEMRNELFNEDITNYLKENFPRSELKVTYSLSYCQGDGLNIYGVLNLYDFLEKWAAPEIDKTLIKFYLDSGKNQFSFLYDNHYSYSCKLQDMLYIEDYIIDMVDELKYNGIENINTGLIKKFYTDMLEHFQELDKKFEKDGYKYLYECEDSEVAEHCEANDYYFTESGEFIG